MGSPGSLIGAIVLTAIAQSHFHVPTNTQSSAKLQPILYLVAAGPQSEKFSRQFGLLSINTELLAKMQILVVPITSSFLTMGWPRGLSIGAVDEATQRAVLKRFGWRDGKQDFLAVLVDEEDRLALRSHEPVTIEQILASLCRGRSARLGFFDSSQSLHLQVNHRFHSAPLRMTHHPEQMSPHSQCL